MNLSKQNYGLLFALAASVLLSLLFVPQFDPFLGDKEVYRYVGRLMLRGGIPYRDAFDHKPPLIFVLNCVSVFLGGSWAQWTIDAALALLATGLFYKLCKKYRLPLPWILPLLFNLMIRDFLICLGMGMTREYTTMLLLIFFCVLMGEHKYRYYVMGLLSGLIFFMQQDQVLALIPFFIYSFLPGQDKSPVLSRMLRGAAGFLTITLLIVLYFTVHGSLLDFWQDAFQFNFTWYTTTLKESFGDHLRRLKSTLDKGNYELPFMVAMTLGVCALIFRSKRKGLMLTCLAAAVLSIAPEFMGGRDIILEVEKMSYTHYFLALSASLCILLFAVFAFTEEPALQGLKPQIIFGTLLCSSLLYTAVQHGTHLERKEPPISTPVFDYILQHRPADYQLYIFGGPTFNYFYNQLGTLAPTRWVYVHFYGYYDKWDEDHAILSTIEQDLLRHRTKYVLDYSGNPRFFRNPAIPPLWHAFLREHYQPLVPALPNRDSEILWILKE